MSSAVDRESQLESSLRDVGRELEQLQADLLKHNRTITDLRTKHTNLAQQGMEVGPALFLRHKKRLKI